MELHLKTDSKSSTTKPPDPSEFPCIPVLLQILMSEYDQERLRAERIDSKTMGLLTIIVALITIYVPIFPFSDFAAVYSKWKTCTIVPFFFSVFILLGVAAILLAIYSVRKLVDAYKTKVYQAVNIANFNSNQKLSQSTAAPFQLELIDHYQSIILENSNINANKAETIDKQFQNVMIIFALLSISAIGTLICKGI